MEGLGFLGAGASSDLAAAFGELRHLHSAFDTPDEARALLVDFLPTTTSAEFLDTAVTELMRWKSKTEPQLKRQRRLHLDKVSQTLSVTGEPASNQAAIHFEEIIHSDPKVFLEVARKSCKKSAVSSHLESRADKEEKERRRFALELASIIEEACLPVSLQIVSLDKPELAWMRIWGNRRAKTLRNRYRAWTRFRSWLVATYGLVWPKDVSHIISFIEELIDLGCPISYPGELMAALSLLEQVGKVLETGRLSSDPLKAEHLKSWKLVLMGERTGRGPARPYTVAILITIELVVVDATVEPYFRFIGWLMLVSNWSSLRVDDAQNIQPETVRLSTRGLSFRLSRTKTTGPGCLHGAVHGFVSRDIISITGEDWMVAGILAMQREDMRFPRDYLVPGPTKDYKGFIPKLIEPPELANSFRMVLSRLATPRFHENKWVPNYQLPLVPETLNLFWSGHSARHFATQAAAGIGIPKEKRDYLGRWAIGRVGSDAYLHTSRQVVESVQREILASLHADSNGFNEDELLEDVKEFAEKQGMIGYRIRRRHKVLPVQKMDPCLIVAEDADASVDEDVIHQRKLDAESAPNRDHNLEEERFEGPKFYVNLSKEWIQASSFDRGLSSPCVEMSRNGRGRQCQVSSF
eukprot:s303_g25.t1